MGLLSRFLALPLTHGAISNADRAYALMCGRGALDCGQDALRRRNNHSGILIGLLGGKDGRR